MANSNFLRTLLGFQRIRSLGTFTSRLVNFGQLRKINLFCTMTMARRRRTLSLVVFAHSISLWNQSCLKITRKRNIIRMQFATKCSTLAMNTFHKHLRSCRNRKRKTMLRSRGSKRRRKDR